MGHQHIRASEPPRHIALYKPESEDLIWIETGVQQTVLTFLTHLCLVLVITGYQAKSSVTVMLVDI